MDIRVRLSEADSEALKAAAHEARLSISGVVRAIIFTHPTLLRHVRQLEAKDRTEQPLEAA